MAKRTDIYCWSIDCEIQHHWPNAKQAAVFFDLTEQRVMQMASDHVMWDGMIFTYGGDAINDLLLRFTKKHED